MQASSTDEWFAPNLGRTGTAGSVDKLPVFYWISPGCPRRGMTQKGTGTTCGNAAAAGRDGDPRDPPNGVVSVDYQASLLVLSDFSLNDGDRCKVFHDELYQPRTLNIHGVRAGTRWRRFWS